MTRSGRAIRMERRRNAGRDQATVRGTRVAWIVGVCVLLALTDSSRALRADEPPARPVVPAAAAPQFDADAVTVEAVPGLHLVDTYRTSPYVAFVTPDAALAAYGILRRISRTRSPGIGTSSSCRVCARSS